MSAALNLDGRGQILVNGHFSSSNLSLNLRSKRKHADISSRMWYRNLLFKMMWLSPVIMLAGIAVHARTYEDSFVSQSTDPTQEQRINSLKGLVIQTDLMLKQNPTGGQVLDLMDRWRRQVGNSKEGRLIPVGADDTCTEGAKSEIFKSSCSLSTYLMNLGQKISAKDPSTALAYYKASLQNSELFKYMDLVSVRSAVLNERRGLRLIAELKLGKGEKSAASLYLTNFLRDQRTLHEMDQLSEEAFNRSRQRAELDLVSLRGQNLEVKKKEKNQLRAFGTESTPELITALRMTHYTQTALESLIKDTIGKLSG